VDLAAEIADGDWFMFRVYCRDLIDNHPIWFVSQEWRALQWMHMASQTLDLKSKIGGIG
jgi:hypothetical protein